MLSLTDKVDNIAPSFQMARKEQSEPCIHYFQMPCLLGTKKHNILKQNSYINYLNERKYK